MSEDFTASAEALSPGEVEVEATRPFDAGTAPAFDAVAEPPSQALSEAAAAPALTSQVAAPTEVLGETTTSAVSAVADAPAPVLEDPNARKRVRAACVECHKRKLKCDMGENGEPCTQCRERGRTCVKRVEKKRGRPRNAHKRVHQVPGGAVQFIVQPHMGGPMVMMAGGGWPGGCFPQMMQSAAGGAGGIPQAMAVQTFAMPMQGPPQGHTLPGQGGGSMMLGGQPPWLPASQPGAPERPMAPCVAVPTSSALARAQRLGIDANANNGASNGAGQSNGSAPESSTAPAVESAMQYLMQMSAPNGAGHFVPRGAAPLPVCGSPGQMMLFGGAAAFNPAIWPAASEGSSGAPVAAPAPEAAPSAHAPPELLSEPSVEPDAASIEIETAAQLEPSELMRAASDLVPL